MSKKISHVAIILKPQNTDELINLIPNLCRWLSKRGCKVYFTLSEKERLKKIFPYKEKEISLLTISEVFKKSQLIITLGGDGTLIGLCRNLTKNIPIFGINRGNLGFITEFGQNDFYDQLQLVLKGDYTLEKKSLFEAKITHQNKVIQKKTFFNDAVITKNDIARMFSLSVSIHNKTGDEHVYDLSGDGLIISTPTGSTAYSLAAGGPIVNPHVKAIILTPISPHALTHRPIVMEDNSVVKIKPIAPFKSVILTLDGQIAIELKDQDTVIIGKMKKSIYFIKNPNRSYYRTLKEKFGHGK